MQESLFINGLFIFIRFNETYYTLYIPLVYATHRDYNIYQATYVGSLKYASALMFCW